MPSADALSSRSSRFAVVAVTLLVAAGVCGCESALTEIIVVVDSELEVPRELDEIVVTVVGASGQPQGASTRLRGAGELPVTVGLRPGSDQNGSVMLHVRGRRMGVERVAAHVSTRFVAGLRLVLRIDLEAECVGILCEEAETCRRGRCVSDAVDPTMLPPFTGTLTGTVDDAGVADLGSRDAGADADGAIGCVADLQCDDADGCNGAEHCDAGACVPGTPMNCDDGVACTVDACAASACTHAASDALCTASPGGRCDPATGCQYATCTASTCASDGCTTATCVGTTCMRTSACTASQMCCGGACVAAGCGDGNPCTDDGCGASGCTHTPSPGTSCSDGDVCTVGDRCNSSGDCAGGGSIDCDDGNLCTDDGCAAGGGCVNPNNNAPCDDGSQCTTSDRCSGGSCGGGPPRSCSDGNPCTTDGCNPVFGCVFPASSNACDDGNACTTGDTCSGGACGAGAAVVCPPATGECQRAVCQAAVGCTTEVDVGAACDDYIYCTDDDWCRIGGYCRGNMRVGCIEP